jgi:hypothetical protein
MRRRCIDAGTMEMPSPAATKLSAELVLAASWPRRGVKPAARYVSNTAARNPGPSWLGGAKNVSLASNFSGMVVLRLPRANTCALGSASTMDSSSKLIDSNSIPVDRWQSDKGSVNALTSQKFDEIAVAGLVQRQEDKRVGLAKSADGFSPSEDTRHTSRASVTGLKSSALSGRKTRIAATMHPLVSTAIGILRLGVAKKSRPPLLEGDPLATAGEADLAFGLEVWVGQFGHHRVDLQVDWSVDRLALRGG